MTNRRAYEHERDIVVMGHYGHGNFGDDLLASFVLNQICRSVPPYRVAVATSGLGYLERWFPGVKCVTPRSLLPWPDGARRRVVFGGGGLFYAFPPAGVTNLWGFLRSTTFRFLRALGWSGMRRTRKYAFCVGIGPLAGFGARLVTRELLKMFDHISVRDLASQELLSQLGIHHSRLVVDPSIGLGGIIPQLPKGYPRAAGFVVRSWPYAPDVNGFLDSLVAAAHALRRLGWEIEFISFESEDRQIVQKLGASGERVRTWKPQSETIRQFSEYLSTYSVLVTMRAHGVFVGSLTGATPIAVEIEPKLRLAARTCGFEDYVLSANSSADEIVQVVQRAAQRKWRTRDWNEELRILGVESAILRRWLQE